MTGGIRGLDRLLSDPTRLSIMAVVCASEWCDFAFLRDTVSLSDSALSKQITTLKGADLVETERAYRGRVPKTSVRASTFGRSIFQAHVEALRLLATAPAGDAVGPSGSDAG